ncbi:MAG: SLBB domain-containing protein, partial [Alphaproteobacteria bacterium]
MQLPQRLGAFARSLAAVIVIAGAAPSAAQTAGGIPSLPGGFSLNDLPPDIQNQLRSQTESEAIPPTLGAEERAPRTVGPASAGPPQPSLLEEQYSRRADRPLTQVGYNIFRPEAGVTFREVGAVQDGYTLGTGDQLVVHMRGRVNRSVTIEVDREGMVVLPELPPIPATGTFGDFRRSLQQEAAQRMAGTDVFVSVARVREIAITMTGEVANPGVITLSGLGSLVDALRLSGGIKKTGSLRNVRIIRGGATITVDLYDFVLGLADSRDLALTNGDRVFVPVIGNTVAVAGQAKRPGIYELPAGTDALTSADLLELGGGVWVRGSYRYAALRVQPDGVEQLVNLARPSADMVRSGEILFVETATDVTVGSVTLSGHARLPGPYPLNAAGTVRTLLRGYEGLLADPYLPFAVVETADPRTRASRFEQFDLGAALSGRRDRRLMNADRVLLLGLEHVRFLSSTQVADALQGRPSGGRCAGLDFLARWVLANPNSDLASGQFATALKGLVGPRSGQVAAAERSLEGAGCPALYDQHPGLLTFALQNSIIVRGNVLNPGVYPVAGPDGINQVMELARSLSSGRQGGVQAVGATAELNRLAAERAAGRPASPPTRVAARPLRGSVADVVEVEEERVRLAGHVRFPGTRSLASARTVRDLIGDDSQFRENPYLLYGIILRRNPRTLMREVVPFSPADVLGGGDPVPLIDRDVVRIFGFEEVRAALQAVRQPAALPDGPAAQAGTETGGSMDMASGAPDGGAVTAPPGAAFGLPPTAAGQQQAPGGILAGGAAGGGGVPAPLAGHSLPEGGAPPAAAGADAAGAGATEASGEEGLLAYGVLTR